VLRASSLPVPSGIAAMGGSGRFSASQMSASMVATHDTVPSPPAATTRTPLRPVCVA